MTSWSAIQALAFASADITATFAGIATVVTALASLVVALRNGRHIDQVRSTVDGRTSSLMQRVEQLTAVVESSDKDVPIRPSSDL